MIPRTDTRKKQIEVDEEVIILDFNAADSHIDEDAGVITTEISKEEAILLRNFLNKKFPPEDFSEKLAKALRDAAPKIPYDRDRDNPLGPPPQRPRYPIPGIDPHRPWVAPAPIWCGPYTGSPPPTLTYSTSFSE